MKRSLVRPATLATAAALILAAGMLQLEPASAAPSALSAPGTAATGGPGAASYFDLARKDCLGTAGNTGSKVWYTIADGVLSDVYEPTVDNTNVETLQYVVTDGATFADLQTRDMTYTVQADPTGMQCTITSTDAKHGFALVTSYITDPQRDTVLMNTRIQPVKGSGTDVGKLQVYARLDAHVNGDGGGGTQNAGGNTGVIDPRTGIPVIYSTNTTTEAANRSYAVPTYMAMTATSAGQASVGYAGTASDGLTQLDGAHALTPTTSAADGHIVATENVTPQRGSAAFTLALGFGRSQQQAVDTATASLRAPFPLVALAYASTWGAYDLTLNQPPRSVPGQSAQTIRRTYYLDANVLKASEDKTFPGAVAASLASPWGQATNAGDDVNGKPVYYGSYREVFSRDSYEAFTGFLADGDLATARAQARFLLDDQQLPTGEIPRNSLLNGKAAPDTGGDQLDETAYPILMAYLSGLGGDNALWTGHIKPAADFLVAHGPSFGVERWEEQSGYSPSTIAAEIAGLTAAAAIAAQHHDAADARVYQATADDFQRNVQSWTVTSTGPDSSSPYFLRLSKTGDPNAANSYNLGNGGPNAAQDTVIDGGFQELARLGELSPASAVFKNSLSVLDAAIAVNTPSGTGYYRYGTSAASGSADGYGDCSTVNSQTSCSTDGEPWPTTDTGTGHLWPVLSGERGESAIAEGDLSQASALLSFMINSASGEGLVPEQVWEDPDLTASPYGSDPTTASIGFTDGQAAGSASPLTWAQAQELRLIVSLGDGRDPPDTPAITNARYVTHGAPGATSVTITRPRLRRHHRGRQHGRQRHRRSKRHGGHRDPGHRYRSSRQHGDHHRRRLRRFLRHGRGRLRDQRDHGHRHRAAATTARPAHTRANADLGDRRRVGRGPRCCRRPTRPKTTTAPAPASTRPSTSCTVGGFLGRDRLPGDGYRRVRGLPDLHLARRPDADVRPRSTVRSCSTSTCTIHRRRLHRGNGGQARQATARSARPTPEQALEVQGFMTTDVVNTEPAQQVSALDRRGRLHRGQDDHDRAAGVRVRHPGQRLDVHRGDHRTERLQRRPGHLVYH